MKSYSHWFLVKSLFVSLFLIAVAAAMPAQATEKKAVDYTLAIGTDALEILSSKTDSDEVKKQKLEGLFTRIVDTDWIGRFVLGATWRTLDEATKTDYLETYRKFLVKHYTQNFAEYSVGTTFKVSRVRKIGRSNKQFLVSVIILRKGQQSVNLDYRIREDGENMFRAIDILVEGVSLLATQRSEFNSVIQRDGVEKLIALLKKKAE